MHKKSRIVKSLYGVIVLLLLVLAFQPAAPAVSAQAGNEYFKTENVVINGAELTKMIISGPPNRPAGVQAETIVPDSSAAKILPVPAYNWVFGCSAVSGSMIAAYYDRGSYPNMYTGPTNGGVMPMDNSVWGTWSDGHTTYPNNPLTASHNGVDGRTTRGSIDDYWIQYGSSAQDPFITNGWTEHSWGTAIGDYMKTSQSNFSNTDGSTTFYNWTSDPSPLTCADMVSYGIHTVDGTYGRKLFYEARGYTVTDCYSRKTDNTISGGFSFADYKAQIDANKPVMINITGHTIVGVGYADPNIVYLNDTWDWSSGVHTMTWGGSYSGMTMQSVSIVNLASSCTGFNSQFNGSTSGWSRAKGTWTNYLSMYYRSAGIANKFATAKHTGTYANFTYQAKMKRTGSCTTCANNIIIRGKANAFDSMYSWKPSYLFEYTNAGSYSVWEISSTGTATALKGWTTSSYIKKNGWNTLKVRAVGSSLKFYINGHLVWSGTDSTLSNGNVGFGFYRNSYTGTLDVDWATLTCAKDDELSEVEVVEAGVEVPGGTIYMSP